MKLKENMVSINGKEEILLCASFFYFRIPKAEWESRARLIAGLGYNSVDVYFPWNHHETEPGEFDFGGERDVEAFLEICSRHGLYVIARPGPYICSEWDGGGLPAWVIAEQDIRQNEAGYLAEVQRWFGQILPLLARHQAGGAANGSVVMMQLENELDFFDCRDVEGYITALRDMALAAGITVPLFACAGQGDIRLSGGLTEGVVPTYNFYPDLTDEVFDYSLARYSRYITGRGMPYLVTETDRKHSVLKRELLAGAKLLGAYNQVGGSNFGYSHAVNNWGTRGTPFSLICTLYDFDGMIDNLGHCTPEADEALLFSHMLRLHGRALAAGHYREMEAPCCFGEEGVAFTNALALAEEGGTLACVRSVRAEAVSARGSFGGQGFTLALDAYGALALPVDMPFAGGRIVFSSCEVFSLDPLILIENGQPLLVLEVDGKQLTVTESGVYGGIGVAFISKAEAIERIKAARGLQLVYVNDKAPRATLCDCETGAYKNLAPFTPAESPLFADNGIWCGEAEYRIQTGGKELFLQGVGDFCTVKNGDAVVFAGLCEGGDILAPGAGEVTALVEQWGHCNFDDARRKSMRIKSGRGIGGIYAVQAKAPLNCWQFTEVDRFAKDVTIQKRATDPRISLNHWNSTHEPLVAAYYGELAAEVRPGEELILLLEGLDAECKLFINERFVFDFAEGVRSVNITGFVKPGEKNTIELVVRKPDWAVRAGALQLLTVTPCAFEMRRVEHLDAYHAALRPAKLPLALKKGEQRVLCVENPVAAATYGYLTGRGYRATVMQAERVIARIVAQDEDIFLAGTTDSSRFLIPHSAESELYIYVEAMQDGTLEFAVREG